VRSVVSRRGKPYVHRCTAAAFEAVALAVGEAAALFTLEDLAAATGLPFTQVNVAFAFLKERGVVAPAGYKRHKAAGGGGGAHLDAMTEYHALREKGPEPAA